MAKFLLVIAVFIVLYLLLRNHARRQDASVAAKGPAPAADAARHGEDMVRCSVCGVHLPTSEAVTSRGEFFCGREHLQLASRDRAQR